MKKPIWLLLFVLLFSNNLIAQQDFPKLTGPYFGMKLPGIKPEVFSSELPPLGLGFSFSYEGNEIFFTRGQMIMVSKIEDNQWSQPQVAPFSGKYRDFDLTMSPDGSKIYFTSNRPIDQIGIAKKDFDIWVVNRTINGWSEPQNIGSPINTGISEVHPSVDQSGDMYFFRDSFTHKPDIFYSKYADGEYIVPVSLGDSINSEFSELDPFIAPDGSYLIYHSNREGGFGGNDLYISFRHKDGSWGSTINMGVKINSALDELSGRVTSDSKYFFFLKYDMRKFKGQHYWVSAKIIEELRPKE
jgi:hypothetical protein